MELLNMLGSLTSLIKRNDVVADVRESRLALESIIIGPLFKMLTLYEKMGVGNDTMKLISHPFYLSYGKPTNRAKVPVLFDVQRLSTNILANLSFIEALASDELEEKMVSVSMGSRATLIVRSADHAAFMADYLYYAIMLSLREIMREPPKGFESDFASLTEDFSDIPKAIEKYLMANAGNFGTAMKIYGLEKQAFAKMLNSAIDIVIPESPEAAASLDQDDIDPMSKIGVMGFNYSPIYYIGMKIDDYKIARYKTLQERKRSLEVRIMVLQNKLAHEEDTALEKELEYTRRRVSDMEAKMRDLRD